MTDVVERAESKYEELRHLTDTYVACQKLRIANSNRVFASTQGADETTHEPFVAEIVGDFEALEKKIFGQMKRTVKHHPAWPWLDNIKGMGPTLSTKVLGLIGDIEKFATISRLWSFAGYGLKPHVDFYHDADLSKTQEITPGNGYTYRIVREVPIAQWTEVLIPEIGMFDDNYRSLWECRVGEKVIVGAYEFQNMGLTKNLRQRPVKGEKLSYNRNLKTALYLCGDSFIKSRSPYRDVYDEAKAYYRLGKQIKPLREILGEERPDEELIVLRETPDGKKEWDKLIKEANKRAGEDQAVWSDGHVDNAARRKMVKLFVSHLWIVWREAEGLPVSDPYVIASPNHPEHAHKIDPWSFSG